MEYLNDVLNTNSYTISIPCSHNNMTSSPSMLKHKIFSRLRGQESHRAAGKWMAKAVEKVVLKAATT